MNKMYYNSWLPKYKSPFGAVLAGETVNFRFLANSQDILSVALIIRKDGDSGAIEGMMARGEEDVFEKAFVLERGVGIYYYFFKVEQITSDGWKTVSYYGCQNHRGGEGMSYDDYGQAWDNSYSITCFSQKEVPPDWYRESVFYQIFPDRFATHLENDAQVLQPKDNIFVYGKKSDTPFYIKDELEGIARWDFFGGTLQGIIDKIPYLKDELGVTALYLNPIFEANSNHRYDTADYCKIDPMLGDEKTFKKLVDTLHENDMRIVLDGVFSHVGKYSKYFNLDGAYGDNKGASKDQNSPYFKWFKFTDWPNAYKSWWGIDDLPEIDKTNRAFQEYIYGDVNSVLAKWNHFDIDGWRLDVADELPDEFIFGIRKNLDTYPEKILIGEVWEDASRKYSYDKRRKYIYGGGLQACMNYPSRELILALLNEQITPQEVAHRLTELQENYPKDVFLNNFNNIGTHDTERIYTLLGEEKQKMSLAFGLMNVLPGVPCYYYGDEAGLTGGKDPDNRKFYPWGKEDIGLLEEMKKWVHVRKENPTLAAGEMEVFYDENLFGIVRYTKEGYTIYIVNPTNKEQKIISENLLFTRFSPFDNSDAKWHEMLDNRVIEAQGGLFIYRSIKMAVDDRI